MSRRRYRSGRASAAQFFDQRHRAVQPAAGRDAEADVIVFADQVDELGQRFVVAGQRIVQVRNDQPIEFRQPTRRAVD